MPAIVKRILLCSFFQFPLIVGAATFEASIQEGDRLVIRGLEAQIQLIGQPGKSLKISGVNESDSAGSYIVEKKNNIIEIKMNEYDSKRDWMNILPQAGKNAKKIEISGLPIATEIQLKSGSVVAQKWSKDLKVNMTQGRFSSTDGSGSLKVYVQKGEVRITNHKGRVSTDSYSGIQNLKNINGDVEASQFAGQFVAEKTEGFFSLTTQQGTAKVSQGVGTLRFDNGKGAFSVEQFKGRLEGETQEGAVNIKMTLDSEVDVKAKAGKVTVQTPANSGVRLNLLTTEGEIYAPKGIYVNKLPTEKNVRQRMRGDAQRGSIFVRSQEGTILVK